MPSRSHVTAVAALLLLTLAGCSQGTMPEPTGLLNVTVSIAPQKYFVQRIGGEHVHVNVMVGPGDEPHTYEPKPEQLKALSRSAVYMRIRVDFEDAWLDKIAAANPNLLIVDTTQGIERVPMTLPHRHNEGEHEEERHEGEPENPDPHIWLSPRLVRVQAQMIYEALLRIDPDHQAFYKANLESLLADIDELDQTVRGTLEGLEARKFMVFHPAWGYFARDFGLEMIPVEIGGQEPSAAELAAVIEVAREENIRVIFAQPELSTRDAETIAKEIGGEVLLISPLAPDWLDNLRQVADTFAGILSK